MKQLIIEAICQLAQIDLNLRILFSNFLFVVLAVMAYCKG